MLRAIIIDDEPLAIDSIAIILKKKFKDEVQVVATSNSPHLGKNLIEEHEPDLVFLDVEMPGMSGIDLVQSFVNPTFRVVFITAFDAYAVEAFRLSALDYLLKPVEVDDIVRVINKIKNEIKKNENTLNAQLKNLISILGKNNLASETKISIGMADKIVFVNIADILYCKAEGAYTEVFMADGKKIVASKNLGGFELQLSPHKFFRIHHSTLINLNRVKEFQRFDGGSVIMDNDVKLDVSHRKRTEFLDALDNFIA